MPFLTVSDECDSIVCNDRFDQNVGSRTALGGRKSARDERRSATIPRQ